MRQLMDIAEDARRVKHAVAALGTNDKNRGLLAIADALVSHAQSSLADMLEMRTRCCTSALRLTITYPLAAPPASRVVPLFS